MELALFIVGVHQVVYDGAGLSCQLVGHRPVSQDLPRTSHRVMPVLGSSIAGTRPFGLTLMNGSCLILEKSIYSASYGTPSSRRMITTFHGFGPCVSRCQCSSPWSAAPFRLMTYPCVGVELDGLDARHGEEGVGLDGKCVAQDCVDSKEEYSSLRPLGCLSVDAEPLY